MVRGPAQGYVFAIHDPDLPEDQNIVYVGNGRQPWLSVRRHIEDSTNPGLKEWSQGLIEGHPQLEILGTVICRKWHGENLPLPRVPENVTRLEWSILDEEDDSMPPVSRDDALTLRVHVKQTTRKAYWVKYLREQGHPLRNLKVGRPVKEK